MSSFTRPVIHRLGGNSVLCTQGRSMKWRTPVFFSRMLHGRGVCRLASPRAVAAMITGSGDIVCQAIVENQSSLDPKRLACATMLGATIEGMALQFWYATLHRHVPGQDSGTLLRRCLLHQVAWAPVAISAFLFTTSLCEAHPEPLGKVQREWWPSLCTHCIIIVPMQLFNATVVLRSYQVLVANASALTWAVAISRLSHRAPSIIAVA